MVLNKQNGDPFVTLEDGVYFIEGVEYTDDIDVLTNAIAKVKPGEYQDMFNKWTSKADYWQAQFNHQWSGGRLILWWNPTKSWNEELARRGELHCPRCNTKMVMYFHSYCPLCSGVKPEGEYYNYHKMAYYIGAKYRIAEQLLNDFSHFLFESLDVNNNCLRSINFCELESDAKEDWLKEISSYFVTEFGDADYDIHFRW